jgi:hypothetical protein
MAMERMNDGRGNELLALYIAVLEYVTRLLFLSP